MYNKKAVKSCKSAIEEYDILRRIIALWDGNRGGEHNQNEIRFNEEFIPPRRVVEILNDHWDLIPIIPYTRSFTPSTVQTVAATTENIQALRSRAVGLYEKLASEIFNDPNTPQKNYLEMKLVELVEQHRILDAIFACARADLAEIFYQVNSDETPYIGLEAIKAVAKENSGQVDFDGNIYAIKPHCTNDLLGMLKSLVHELDLTTGELVDYLRLNLIGGYIVDSGLEAAHKALKNARQTEDAGKKAEFIEAAIKERNSAFKRDDAYKYIWSRTLERRAPAERLYIDFDKINAEYRQLRYDLKVEQLKLDPKREEIVVLSKIINFGETAAESKSGQQGNTIAILERNLDLLVKKNNRYSLPAENADAFVKRIDGLVILYNQSRPRREGEQEAIAIPESLRYARDHIQFALTEQITERQKQELSFAAHSLKTARSEIIPDGAITSVESEPVYIMLRRVEDEFRQARDKLFPKPALTPAERITAAGPGNRGEISRAG